MNKHKPATALPWHIYERDARCVMGRRADRADIEFSQLAATTLRDPMYAHHETEDAAYIAHACNAYPRLVEALKKAHVVLSAHWFSSDGEDEYNNDAVIEADKHAIAILRELGELE